MSQKTSTPVVPMRAVCAGRYVVDVPASITSVQMGQSYNGITIETRAPATTAQLRADAEKAVAGETRVTDAMTNTMPANLPKDATIHIFEDGNNLYTLRGGIIRSDVGYEFHVQVPGDSVGGAKAAIANLINKLEPRDNFANPSRPGFCIDHGFVAGPSEGSESITLSADWPEQGVKITVTTETNASREEPGLIARMTSLPAPLANLFDKSSEVLRKRSRSVAGRDGDEFDYLDHASSDLALEWRAVRGNDAVSEPAMQLRLETTNGAGKINKDRFLAVWDDILDSVGRRDRG
jgi:hypothetical protein